jgi:hypothetical protein
MGLPRRSVRWRTLFAVFILIDSLGDCALDVDCHKGFWSNVALPTIAVGLIIALLIRAVVNRFGRKAS